MGKAKKKGKVGIPFSAEDYQYQVGWSEEDRVFIARCIEFGGLAAHGDTMDDALREARVVVAESLRWLAEEGDPIPKPFSKRHYSGKLNLRLPAERHRALVMEAEQQGVSLNQLIVLKLSST